MLYPPNLDVKAIKFRSQRQQSIQFSFPGLRRGLIKNYVNINCPIIAYICCIYVAFAHGRELLRRGSHLKTETQNMLNDLDVNLPERRKLWPRGGQSQFFADIFLKFQRRVSVIAKCCYVQGTRGTLLFESSIPPTPHVLYVKAKSKYLTLGSLRLRCMTPTVKRNGDGETEMLVGEGSISFMVYDVQVMIFLLSVLMATLVKSTANITRMTTEQKPPVAVLKSDSPLYLMNCDTANKSHVRRKDFTPPVTFLSMSDLQKAE